MVRLAGYPVAITVHALAITRHALMDRCRTSSASFVAAGIEYRILNPSLIFGGHNKAALWEQLSNLVRIGDRQPSNEHAKPRKYGERNEFDSLKAGIRSILGAVMLAKFYRVRAEGLFETHMQTPRATSAVMELCPIHSKVVAAR